MRNGAFRKSDQLYCFDQLFYMASLFLMQGKCSRSTVQWNKLLNEFQIEIWSNFPKHTDVPAAWPTFLKILILFGVGGGGGGRDFPMSSIGNSVCELI